VRGRFTFYQPFTLTTTLDLTPIPLATYFQHPAHKATPKAKAILVQADQFADTLNLDDELVDGLLVGLKLE
jgi:hypothetical protein